MARFRHSGGGGKGWYICGAGGTEERTFYELMIYWIDLISTPKVLPDARRGSPRTYRTLHNRSSLLLRLRDGSAAAPGRGLDE